MNDRFKFRFWNKGNKKIETYSNDDLGFLLSNPKAQLRYVVMQCTGLKDKNGKLIYEGDILRYPANDKIEEKNYVACEVFFHNNDCCDNHIGFQMNRYRFQGNLCGIANYGRKYKFIPENTKKMEVIGNIYENEDLLKCENQ